MELYQLKTFVAVAEEGLLTRAANRLHSSQPAISAHIKALESELGVILFDRTPKGMRLTAEGELLKIKALVILDAANDLSYTASSLKGIPSGDVRLGLHTDPVQLRITEIFSQFQQDFPKLSLNYMQKMSWQAPREVLLGNLDAAFMYTKPENEKLTVQIIDNVQLVIVAPLDWQDRLENATLKDLASFPWIWTDERCPLYKAADELFSTINQQPLKAVIVDGESAIFKLVSSGVGLSLMPALKAGEASRQGQLCISKIPAPKLELSLIYLQSRENDPIVKAICAVVNHIWQTTTVKLQNKPVQMSTPVHN